jgi:hypothetical protein
MNKEEVMKLIRTRDGKIGTEVDRRVMWHKSPNRAYEELMSGMLPINVNESYTYIQVQKALSEMSKSGNNVAEFGVFGSYMYSYMDLGYEE